MEIIFHPFVELEIKQERKLENVVLPVVRKMPSFTELGVWNCKIRDSPRRGDPCFKMRARDFSRFVKSEPETVSSENTSLRRTEPKIRAR